MNTSAVYQDADADKAHDIILTKFKTKHDKHSSYRIAKTTRNNRKPKVTRELLGKIHNRNVLYKKFVKTKVLKIP